MYPIWLMLWKLRIRRNSICATAPATPVSIVRHASTRITQNSPCGAGTGGNTSVNTRTSEYTPTFVSSAANSADTAAGGVA